MPLSVQSVLNTRPEIGEVDPFLSLKRCTCSDCSEVFKKICAFLSWISIFCYFVRVLVNMADSHSFLIQSLSPSGLSSRNLIRSFPLSEVLRLMSEPSNVYLSNWFCEVWNVRLSYYSACFRTYHCMELSIIMKLLTFYFLYFRTTSKRFKLAQGLIEQ